jgi:hypothetical protein
MLPKLLREFRRRLGEINVKYCVIDSVLCTAENNSLEQGAFVNNWQIHANQVHFLDVKSLPSLSNLKNSIATHSIVFLSQTIEAFFDELNVYLKSINKFQPFDPTNSDTRPDGEDYLRRIVRKIQLIEDKAKSTPNYNRETDSQKKLREDYLEAKIGVATTALMDYFRAIRNAAVHFDKSESTKRIFKERVDPQLDCIYTSFKLKPSPPDELINSDTILYSKLLQNVAETLCRMSEPDIENDVLPLLRVKFSRYGNANRRRNAIIGALRSDYLLDTATAERYADS